jgi:hypothetical protein
MMQKHKYTLLAFLVAAAMISCGESSEQRHDAQGEDSVNRTDTRRYTDTTINTIPDTGTLNVDTTRQ